MSTIRALALGLLVFALSGCMSSLERANELYEKGQYAEAAGTYQYVLQYDPQNADALEGLKKSQVKVIENRLIEIRKLRMAGDADGATQALLGVMNELRSKGIGSNAAYTMEEELDFGTKNAIGKLRTALRENKPLKATGLINSYEPLFQEKRKAEFDKVKADNQAAGRDMCAGYQRQSFRGLPFMAEYIARMCTNVFGKEFKARDYDPADATRTLVRDVELAGSAHGLAQNFVDEAGQKYKDALKASPWYHPNGGVVWKMGVSGHFSEQVNRVPIQLVHQYTAQENYVTVENVNRTRQVPYETYEPVQVMIAGQLTTQQQRVTKYRTESYTERMPVERTRDVQRTYPYGAFSVTKALALDLDVGVTDGPKFGGLKLAQQGQWSDTENPIAVPSVGLGAKGASLPDTAQWIRSQIDASAATFQRQATDLWMTTRCNPPPQAMGSLAAGNHALGCTFTGKAQAPKALDDWMLKSLGVTAADAAAIIK